jgi:MtrB/PioB family decaheme-associated outer membrane protein
MKTHNTRSGFQLKLIVLSLLVGAFGPAAHAEGEDLAPFIKPESSISVGASAVSGDSADRAFFGQYNGMRQHRGQIQLDIDYLKREDSTGTWTSFNGRNLGNENREIGFAQQKQGDWRYQFEYGELVRNYSNTINTAMSGIGSNNLTITALGVPPVPAAPNAAALAAAQGSGSNVDLKTTRKALGLAVDKWLTPYLQFEASFKNEDKTGARMFGRGFNCSAGFGCVTVGANTNTFGAILLMPEPINSVTRQVELKLNYSNDKLAVNGGYYGSFYTNKFGSLSQTFAGRLWNPDGSGFDPRVGTGNSLQTAMGPIALPPDNQSHQLSVAGTYAFTPTTRGTFKFAKTHGTQNDRFADAGFMTSPRGALDAVIDTTTAQVGLTSRPLPKLSIVANLRWEKKSDKTPIDLYSPTAGHTNSWGSHEKINGKLEASYQLANSYRGTVGLDYDFRDLGRPANTNETNGQASAMRAKNQELGVRGELRKSMADNLSGAVSIAHSYRNGSRWMQTNAGVYAPTMADGDLQGAGFNLFPLISMDLLRDKLKLSTDWAPTDNLSLQASIDGAAEHYFAPTMRGARDGKTTNLNLDAAYKVSDNWKVNGWYSRGDTILDINGPANAYMAGLRQLGHNLGLGVRGAPTGKLEVGADFTFSYEVNRTGVGVSGTNLSANALPAAAFRQLNLNMFGKYALDKSADIKVSLLHQRYYSNEWFWNNNGTSFFYSDGTTVTQKDQQNVTFIGAAYIYKFQ